MNRRIKTSAESILWAVTAVLLSPLLLVLIVQAHRNRPRPSKSGHEMAVYLPPKFDLRSNRQLWFVETGHNELDNLVNGVLTSLLFFSGLGVALQAGGFA